MKYIVYVIYNNESHRTYVEQTNSLSHRLAEHNAGLSTWTSRFPGTWEVIHQEVFDSRSAAIRRERQLKSGGGRRFIQSLVAALEDGEDRGR